MANGFNPFAGILNSVSGAIAEGMGMGQPTALVEREMAERGATGRTGMALNAAAGIRAEDRAAFAALGDEWRRIVGSFGPNGPTTPADATRAIRELMRSPTLFAIPPQHAQAYVSLLTSMVGGQATGDPFTLTPGARRFDAQGREIAVAPPNPPPPAPFTLGPGQRRFDAQGNPITETQPGPRQPGPLDARRAETMNRWLQAGEQVDLLEPVATELERALLQPGAAANTFVQLWENIRSRLGLAAGTTPRAVAEAMRVQLVRAMHGVGAGPMTDADARLYALALPNIGNDPAANRTIADILARNMARIRERSELAREALEINTPGAVDTALRIAGNPEALRTRAHVRNEVWVSETYRVTPDALRPRTRQELDALAERLIAADLADDGQVSPRLRRFIEELRTRIVLGGR